MNLKYKYLPYITATLVLFATVSATTASELKLAGITLGRPAMTAMQKYGDPTEIRVGNATNVQKTQKSSRMPGSSRAGMPTMPGMPGMPTGIQQRPAGLPGMPQGMNSDGQDSLYTQPGMPGMPAGMEQGGMPGMPGMPGMQKSNANQTKAGPSEVTWIYRFPKNRRLEIIVNADGVIVQVAVYGIEWKGVKTSKGIHLGSTYKDVNVKYGYPESQQINGTVLLARYPQKHRAVFSFIGKKCVGIAVAL